MEIFHCYRDMIMFPDVADDPAAHILYMLKFVKLVLQGAS